MIATRVALLTKKSAYLVISRFSLLGGRIEHFVAQVAAAYQLSDWLALGIGASVMPEAFTRNFIYMNDAARQDEVDLNIGLQTATQWRLNAGLLVTPNERFKWGVNYRDEQFMTIRGLNEVQVRGLQGSDSYPFEQNLYIITDYSPRQFTYALQYTSPKKSQSLSLDLVYTLWSDYLDSHGERVNFEDVWSPRVGYEYLIHWASCSSRSAMDTKPFQSKLVVPTMLIMTASYSV